jgi:hypothetical protein
MRWRFEETPPEEPVQLPRRSYSCEYRYYNQPNLMKCRPLGSYLSGIGITMRKGMQGLVVEIRGCLAHVRLFNIMHDGKPVEVIIPTWTLQGESRPYYNQSAWRLDVSLPIPSFPIAPPPTQTGLMAATIEIFIRITQSENMTWLPPAFCKATGDDGQRIPSIRERGIAVSHYILGDSRKPNRPYVRPFLNVLDVRQLVLNSLDCTIPFTDNHPSELHYFIPPPNGNLRSDAATLAHLKNVSREVLRIDEHGTYRKGDLATQKQRTQCDTCFMSITYFQCTKDPGDILCTNCKITYDRPACTYTDGVATGKMARGGVDTVGWPGLFKRKKTSRTISAVVYLSMGYRLILTRPKLITRRCTSSSPQN